MFWVLLSKIIENICLTHGFLVNNNFYKLFKYNLHTTLQYSTNKQTKIITTQTILFSSSSFFASTKVITLVWLKTQCFMSWKDFKPSIKIRLCDIFLCGYYYRNRKNEPFATKHYIYTFLWLYFIMEEHESFWDFVLVNVHWKY